MLKWKGGSDKVSLYIKMKIVNGFDLMKYAKDNGYILPAFNTTNLEMTFAIAKGERHF